MLDPKRLRQNPQEVADRLARRGVAFDLARFESLESQRKQLQTETEQLQATRNKSSKEIGFAKSKGLDATPLFEQVEAIKQQLSERETALAQLQVELEDFLLRIPNLPHESVPDGSSEADNLELRRWGTPRQFSFTPKDHADIGEALGQMDFAAGAKLTGSRFVVLKRDIARLHRALIQFMLDVHTEQHGYEELYVPYLVNAASLKGTGQLPKFREDLFGIKDDEGRDWCLIPTAEVPVTNLLRDEIVEAAELPKKWVAHTPCFRSEAGSGGRDIKGMIRQHQFEKVQLVQAVLPQQSYAALGQTTGHAEAILQNWNYPTG